MHLSRLLCAVGILACASGVASAQIPARVPIGTRTYIGINPLGLPADIGTAEIETALLQGVTLGGVGSYIDVSDTRFTTFDVKLRYYPGDVVLRGFSVGASGGVTRFSNVHDKEESLTAPTVGIIADYNWLLGRSEHFLIGTGVGAKRVLASETERGRANVDRAVFTTRLIFAFAF